MIHQDEVLLFGIFVFVAVGLIIIEAIASGPRRK